jgi:chitinase
MGEKGVMSKDFETIFAFAQQSHLARFTFWALNRDRPCQGSLTPAEDCSGIAQLPFAFSDVVAAYHG